MRITGEQTETGRSDTALGHRSTGAVMRLIFNSKIRTSRPLSTWGSVQRNLFLTGCLKRHSVWFWFWFWF